MISEMRRDSHRLRVETEVIDVNFGLIKTYVPGRTSYYLDGQPITLEQAEAFLNGADMVEVTAMGDDHRRFVSVDRRDERFRRSTERFEALLAEMSQEMSQLLDGEAWERGPDVAFWSPDMDERMDQ